AGPDGPAGGAAAHPPAAPCGARWLYGCDPPLPPRRYRGKYRTASNADHFRWAAAIVGTTRCGHGAALPYPEWRWPAAPGRGSGESVLLPEPQPAVDQGVKTAPATHPCP